MKTNVEKKKELLHYLKSSLLLLGGKPEIIINIFNEWDNGNFNNAIDQLRNYNCKLIDQIKDRLTYLPTIKVKFS